MNTGFYLFSPQDTRSLVTARVDPWLCSKMSRNAFYSQFGFVFAFYDFLRTNVFMWQWKCVWVRKWSRLKGGFCLSFACELPSWNGNGAMTEHKCTFHLFSSVWCSANPVATNPKCSSSRRNLPLFSRRNGRTRIENVCHFFVSFCLLSTSFVVYMLAQINPALIDDSGCFKR